VAAGLRRSPDAAVPVGTIAHDCGPEPSLRTAPSSSSSAFGSLQIPSGASTALVPTGTATPCYEGLWFARYKTCGQGRRSAGPPGCCRPDGGNPAYERCDVGAVNACALVTVSLLMCRPHGGGAVMGGAATASHNLATSTRRPSGTGVQMTINDEQIGVCGFARCQTPNLLPSLPEPADSVCRCRCLTPLGDALGMT